MTDKEIDQIAKELRELMPPNTYNGIEISQTLATEVKRRVDEAYKKGVEDGRKSK